MKPAAHIGLEILRTRILLVVVMAGSALGLFALGALLLSWQALAIVTAAYVAVAGIFFYFAGQGRAVRQVVPELTGRKAHCNTWPEYGQIVADIVWVSCFVRITGGTENNPFSLLFFLAIIAASYIRFVRGAIVAATAASAAYGILLWLDLAALHNTYALPFRAGLPWSFNADFYLHGYVYAICFYLVGALSGYLSERVRQKGQQLEIASKALHDFRLSTGDILEKMGSGLLTIDSAGQIRYCNTAGAQIIGPEAGQLIKQNIADIFKNGFYGFGQVLAKELRAEGHRAVRREVTVTRADGAEIPVGISTTPIEGEGKSVHGLIAIFQDLSEVKQTERRLLEIEQVDSMRELTAALLSQIKPEAGRIDEALRPILEGRLDARAAQSMAALSKQRLDVILKTVDDYIRFARIDPGGIAPEPANGSSGTNGIIGCSPSFTAVMAMIRQIAPTDSTVLISGESGTGKELLAKELHRLSQRSQGPFVCINCAALPETLLESELFGHVRGSFTGAVRDKEGLFRVASGGTVFLDEVSETSPAIQVKLLRVLQEREIIPVGGTRPIKVDVRLISATNIDLSRAVEQGKFRTDLFYRINVIPVKIPPLRERPDDIPLLTEHFLRKIADKQGNPVKKLSSAARNALQNHCWTGNVRELENAVERAVVLAPGALIEPDHLPPEIVHAISAAEGETVAPDNQESISLKTGEKQAIIKALKEANGNRTKAARMLGIHYATLYRKIKQYGV